MYPLTLSLWIANPASREEVHACLRDLQVRVVLEAADSEDWHKFTEKVDELHPGMVILDLAALSHSWPEAVRRLKASPSSPLVIALDESADPELILGAIRAGANEYVYPPFKTNLRKALDQLSQEWARQRSESGTQGRILGFFSAKGGCGATTLACLTSTALQRATHQQLLLADFDLSLGMVSFLMKTKSRYSLLDALQNTHRLDVSYWKALVTNGTPGIEVIPAPAATDFGEDPPPDRFRHVLRFARLNYDWILVDLGRALTQSTLNLLEEIDEALLVSTAEVPALYQVKRTLEMLAQFGYSKDRVRVVINRVPKSLDLTAGDLEGMLGTQVWAMLPDDPDGLYEAFSAGKQLPPGCPLNKHIQKLISKLTGASEDKARKKFGLF